MARLRRSCLLIALSLSSCAWVFAEAAPEQTPTIVTAPAPTNAPAPEVKLTPEERLAKAKDVLLAALETHKTAVLAYDELDVEYRKLDKIHKAAVADLSLYSPEAEMRPDMTPEQKEKARKLFEKEREEKIAKVESTKFSDSDRGITLAKMSVAREAIGAAWKEFVDAGGKGTVILQCPKSIIKLPFRFKDSEREIMGWFYKETPTAIEVVNMIGARIALQKPVEIFAPIADVLTTDPKGDEFFFYHSAKKEQFDFSSSCWVVIQDGDCILLDSDGLATYRFPKEKWDEIRGTVQSNTRKKYQGVPLVCTENPSIIPPAKSTESSPPAAPKPLNQVFVLANGQKITPVKVQDFGTSYVLKDADGNLTTVEKKEVLEIKTLEPASAVDASKATTPNPDPAKVTPKPAKPTAKGPQIYVLKDGRKITVVKAQDFGDKLVLKNDDGEMISVDKAEVDHIDKPE